MGKVCEFGTQVGQQHWRFFVFVFSLPISAALKLTVPKRGRAKQPTALLCHELKKYRNQAKVIRKKKPCWYYFKCESVYKCWKLLESMDMSCFSFYTPFHFVIGSTPRFLSFNNNNNNNNNVCSARMWATREQRPCLCFGFGMPSTQHRALSIIIKDDDSPRNSKNSKSKEFI